MNGLIVVNKERDWTSRDVVNKISSIFDTPRVGHTGTLDPLATGVLVIAIGEGLKLVDLLSCDIKEYVATVALGILTDTLDITGNVIEKKDFKIDREEIIKVLNSFLGKSIQEVPLYSSVKVNGKRLYDYARNNLPVVLPKREIEIYKIELLDTSCDTFTFKVSVSKGTYIRSLIRDIGKKLDIPCTMKDLHRTRQGQFSIADSHSIKDIENGNFKLISFYAALSFLPMIEVDDYLEKKIKNGRILENRYQDERIVFVNSKKEVLAIYEVYKKDVTKVKPLKVFNL